MLRGQRKLLSSTLRRPCTVIPSNKSSPPQRSTNDGDSCNPSSPSLPADPGPYTSCSDCSLHQRKLMSMLRREVKKGDACRIYGMMEIHKCHGDFHITARGHGYQQFGGEHLDHDSNPPRNFSCFNRQRSISRILLMNFRSGSIIPKSITHSTLLRARQKNVLNPLQPFAQCDP